MYLISYFRQSRCKVFEPDFPRVFPETVQSRVLAHAGRDRGQQTTKSRSSRGRRTFGLFLSHERDDLVWTTIGNEQTELAFTGSKVRPVKEKVTAQEQISFRQTENSIFQEHILSISRTEFSTRKPPPLLLYSTNANGTGTCSFRQHTALLHLIYFTTAQPRILNSTSLDFGILSFNTNPVTGEALLSVSTIG